MYNPFESKDTSNEVWVGDVIKNVETTFPNVL